MTHIVWFRRDLRLDDNPAFNAAAARGDVLPIYVNDTTDPRPHGSASRWWLHQNLAALQADLQARGGDLLIFQGDPKHLIPALVTHTKARGIFWNRDYTAHRIAADSALKTTLQQTGTTAQSFNANLLFEPWEIKNKSGDYFKVFTPFWKAASQHLSDLSVPCVAPEKITFSTVANLANAMTLDDLALQPTAPNWASGFSARWPAGEAGAAGMLRQFMTKIDNYKQQRDVPSIAATSKLSPYLALGIISPKQILAAVQSQYQPPYSADVSHFLSEVGWREFSYHLLYHNPNLATTNFKSQFDRFPWQDNPERLRAWQRGQTGIPIVDAGMRELWHTGWMHNRVRMIVASFLIKNCLTDWRLGEKWFWDTLLDADPGNNPAGWQWVAGSGADAAPYFRIFSPISQAEKFDPEAAYIKKWVPELQSLPAKYCAAPWEAPAAMLSAAGVTLGEDYPRPVVDLKETRALALAAYDQTK